MKIKKNQFGVLADGTKVNLFSIDNGKMSLSVTEYGAAVTSIVLFKKNEKVDVTLGYSTLDGYVGDTKYFGTTVARFANRIGGAAFTLEGRKYELDKNSGEDCLHSGYENSGKMVWKSKIVKKKNSVGVKFSRVFSDGEQGFPGNLKVSATYSLDDQNRVKCVFKGETDAPTPINIVNHTYFNLAGRGSILEHSAKLNCQQILEVDENLVPTGKFLAVAGTAFDFTAGKKIGENICEVGSGYDNCFVTENYSPENAGCAVPSSAKNVVPVAELANEATGTKMIVCSNNIGVQFYTGNYIEGIVGKNGVRYQNQGGVCFETQSFPDSPNKENFPSAILFPGKKYKAVTVYEFSF